ncbi:hypothetical protein AAVH_33151, partial [Aphelenchoides avenae]
TRLVFYVYKVIPKELWESNWSLAQGVYDFGTLLEHVVYVANNCQPLCHKAIAFNRFSAFVFSTRHSRIWNRSTVLVLTLTIFSAAVLLAGTPSVYLGVLYARLTRKYIDYNGLQHWETEKIYISGIVRSFNLIVCCFVSFALNMGTVFMFVRRRLSISAQLTLKGQDAKLF